MVYRIIPAVLFLNVLFFSTHTGAVDYQVTPVSGYRISDSLQDEITGGNLELDETSASGFILSARRDNVSWYDFLFNRQDTVLHDSFNATTLNVRIDYYHLGGTVYYRSKHNIIPFATGGLGLTHASVSDSSLDSESRASLSVGTGLKLPLTERIGLRLEIRMYGTLIDANGSILCANGACTARLNGNFYAQFETSAGLSIAF
jgi:opacity protein-like surface antigen